MQNITYHVKNAIYVNLTNRCPCACTFCLRQLGPGAHGSVPLWLEHEPTAAEVCADLTKWDWNEYKELVFCGYGEPTERLDVLVTIAKWMRENHPEVKIRVNTNGLGDLIWGRDITLELAGKSTRSPIVDTVSVSLNTDDPEEYLKVCRPKFGAAAYPALKTFAQNAARRGIKVVMTIVDTPVTTKEQQARCREIAESLGATLRIRPYESK